MSQVHPMMAEANHDERAEQLFVRDLKVYLQTQINPIEKRIVDSVAADKAARRNAPAPMAEVREALLDLDTFRSWVGYRRLSQEMLWDAVGTSVDRQLSDLSARADEVAAPKGSLTLDTDFEQPRYLQALDTHMMPGGYPRDDGGVRQGAVMDRGGAVYMLGRNGGLMNDARGHVIVQHLFDRYPDVDPAKILEIGCGVGPSLVAAAGYFPEAEVHGVDVGASLLRYAHARAEHLGSAIHFSQQNAEHLNFPDDSFDLVFSAVVIHETSGSAVRNIMRETHRVLKPGGVVIHLEVPTTAHDASPWDRVMADFESMYNNEPFWRGSQDLDFPKLLQDAGFRDPLVGYQAAAPRAERGVHAFGQQSFGPFRSWFITSARK